MNNLSQKLLTTLALVSFCGSIGTAQEVSAVEISGGDTARNHDSVVEAKAARAASTVAQPRVTAGPGDTIIPHIVDGGGWRTTFTFINLENYSVRFKLLFLSDNARDLYLPIVGVGVTSGIQVSLPATATITIETGVGGSLVSGWAYMLPENPGDSIGGLGVFRQSVPGRPDFEAVVPIVSQFEGHFAMLFDNVGFTTAMALSNTTINAVTVAVVIRGESGAVLQRDTIYLPPLSHGAFTIPERFVTTGGRRGSIEFLASEPGVAALGLRFGAASFTSFHVLSNPLWK